MTLPQIIEPLPQLPEPRIVLTATQPPGDLDLDLLGLLVRIRGAKYRFEQVGVEDERVEIVPNSVNVHMLMDEFDRLRPQDVPEELPRPSRRLNGLVDLHQPAVVGLAPAQDRVGRDGLPEAAQVADVSGEPVASVVVR